MTIDQLAALDRDYKHTVNAAALAEARRGLAIREADHAASTAALARNVARLENLLKETPA